MVSFTITAGIFPITVFVPGMEPIRLERGDLPATRDETRPLVVWGREVGTMTRYRGTRQCRKVRFDVPDSVTIERANSRRRRPDPAGGVSATITDTEQ